jgi:hypothetical protein
MGERDQWRWSCAKFIIEAALTVSIVQYHHLAQEPTDACERKMRMWSDLVTHSTLGICHAPAQT